MFKKIFIGILLFSGMVHSQVSYCKDRGGCYCECSWTKKINCKTAVDDKSCCFSCCCFQKLAPTTGPTPINPTPSPVNPDPNPVPNGLVEYCPTINDLVAAYGNPTLINRGWVHKNGGGVATKSAFNLLGGSVEYDIDLTGVYSGVNGNVYTLSPTISNPTMGFTQKDYCDGAKTGAKWCTEIDWLESNGNCGGATTLHMVEGPGNNGCTAWGCRTNFLYNGKTKFHMKIEYTNEGIISVYRDDKNVGSFNPEPTNKDISVLIEQYKKLGAVIYSSLWKGWVPLEKTCPPSSADLTSSTFTVSNLIIRGKLVQGPEPTRC